jgi:curved DNA-binding protein CbpA
VTQDYYTLLKIRRDATQDEVKRAYRRLARELHPDVNPDPETQERFKEITQAYDVLSDTEKRRMYDMGYIISADGVKHPVNNAPPGNSGSAPGDSYFDRTVADVFNLFTQNGFMHAPGRKSAAEKLAETLDVAVRYESLRTVKNLIAHGARPTQKTLRYAVQHKSARMVKALLASGIVPDRRTLDYAMRYEKRAKVDLLFAAAHMRNKPYTSQFKPRTAPYGTKNSSRNSSRRHGFFG